MSSVALPLKSPSLSLCAAEENVSDSYLHCHTVSSSFPDLPAPVLDHSMCQWGGKVWESKVLELGSDSETSHGLIPRLAWV